MIRLCIAALLMTAVATVQTTPEATKPGSTTRASIPRTGGSASKSVAKPDRPIPAGPPPEQPLRTKLRTANSTNPNYNREKDRGRGTKREYTPRRTALGARKDTMNQRKPGDPVPN